MNSLNRQNKLWEGSRMFLPEHREALLQQHRDNQKITPPKLDEQQMECIHYTLQEAFMKQESVLITYISTYKFNKLYGKIKGIDSMTRRVFIATESGDIQIPFYTLIHAEIF